MPTMCPFDASSTRLFAAFVQLSRERFAETIPTWQLGQSPLLPSLRRQHLSHRSTYGGRSSNTSNVRPFSTTTTTSQGVDWKNHLPRKATVKEPREQAHVNRQKQKQATVTQDEKKRYPGRLSQRAQDKEDADGAESSAQSPPKHEPWFLYKEALKRKFPEGWNPRKKISPDAMEGMRALHAQYPEQCTLQVLANQFKISQEAVRRILKAKPKPAAMQAHQRERWAKRHDKIWDNMSQLGLRPQRTEDRSSDDNDFTMPNIERSA